MRADNRSAVESAQRHSAAAALRSAATSHNVGHGSAECHRIDRWDGRRYELRIVLLRIRRRCKWRAARRLRLAAAAAIRAGFERIMLARGQRFDCDGDGRSIGGGCELHRLRSRAAARRVEREAKDCLTKKLPQL